MGIESNKEAYQTMKNSIGSMENRMREVYNKGYKDGIKEGINQAMQKIADSILEEVKADRKTENSSEKPNNCEHITEDGVTCAKYPACDDCLDNPLNKLKGSERLVKGSEQTDLVEDSPSLVKDLVKAFCEDGTWLERQGVYTLTLAEAKQRAVDIIESVLAKDEPTISKMEQVDKDINVRSKDEPYIDIETGILHWCGWKYRRIYEDEPQTHTVDLGNGFSITANDCDTCKHRDKPFDDLPCDMCCKAHSGYEPKDEPQTDGYISGEDFMKIFDEPQTEEGASCRQARAKKFGEMDDATFKAHCMNCQRDPADIKCLDCDGNKYFLSYGAQTDCAWKNECK